MEGRAEADGLKEAIRRKVAEIAEEEGKGQTAAVVVDEEAPYDAYAIKLARKLDMQKYLNERALAANEKRYQYFSGARKHIFLPYLDYSLAAIFGYLVVRRRLRLLSVGGLALGASLANEYTRIAQIAKAHPDETAELFRLDAELKQVMKILRRDYAHRYPIRRYMQFMRKEHDRSTAEEQAMGEVLGHRLEKDVLSITLPRYSSPIFL